MRILVTGFEPFGQDAENASQLAVRRLAATWAGEGVHLSVATLPVEFAAAPERLWSLVDELRPDAVLSVGEAGGRAAITPERGGRNWVDARIPDNAGARPRAERIDSGPDRRPASLDVDDMVARMRAAGLPAEVSEDAGAFVCNRIAYEAALLPVLAAFIHVPAVRTAGVARVGAETDAGPAVVAGLGVADLADALAHCVHSAAQTVRRAQASPR